MNFTDKDKVLITTAIDYVNDVIHIGHAYQKVLEDCLTRYLRLVKDPKDVHFVTGTDEHGQKVFKIAQDKNLNVKAYVDDISKLDQDEQDALNVGYDRFIRTTDEDHKKRATEFFKKVYDNGYIYKKTYVGKYCVGCESYKTDKDLEDGECPLHPNNKIQDMEEENYFFKLSAFRDFLKELFDSDSSFVLPQARYNDMYALIDGLEDIPITRTKEKLPWGIECPVDSDHVIWVWFDALINYLTFGEQVGAWDEDTYIIHFLGKDNARTHALLWPAMLKAADENYKINVYVNAFFSLNGQKISKSIGNIIRPTELVEKYGVDPIRYFFLRYGPLVEDSDFNVTQFETVFNADLANGIGNLTARLTKLCERSNFAFPVTEIDKDFYLKEWAEPLKELRFDLVLNNIWEKISDLDKHINDNEPWAIKNEQKLKEVLTHEISELRNISYMLVPFIPDTAKKMQNQILNENIKSGGHLFSRLEK